MYAATIMALRDYTMFLGKEKKRKEKKRIEKNRACLCDLAVKDGDVFFGAVEPGLDLFQEQEDRLERRRGQARKGEVDHLIAEGLGVVRVFGDVENQVIGTVLAVQMLRDEGQSIGGWVRYEKQTSVYFKRLLIFLYAIVDCSN
jgi:hypothetical protein